MCVIDVVEQNVKVLSSYVYHRLYFTHKLKNPIIKPHRKILMEPVANYSSGFWHHSSPTLLNTHRLQCNSEKSDNLIIRSTIHEPPTASSSRRMHTLTLSSLNSQNEVPFTKGLYKSFLYSVTFSQQLFTFFTTVMNLFFLKFLVLTSNSE